MMNYIGNQPAPPGLILVGDTNPIGMISFFHNVPDGSYLRLNGQGVAKATYPDLWVYAQGFLTADQTVNPGLYRDSGGATFFVPNLTGLFIRGQGTWDANRASAALGVRQDDDNKSHTHSINLAVGGGAIFQAGGNGIPTTTGASGGTEARPINVGLIPCVKALKTALLPTQAMPAAPTSDYVLLQSQDAAASAQLDFALPSAYDVHVLEFIGMLPSTDDVQLGLRISTDGGATFKSGAADYRSNGVLIQHGTLNPVVNNITYLSISQNMSNTLLEGGMSGRVSMYGFNSTATTGKRKWATVDVAHWRSGTGMEKVNYGDRYDIDASTITNVRVFATSGNLASGRVKLYGLR